MCNIKNNKFKFGLIFFICIYSFIFLFILYVYGYYSINLLNQYSQNFKLTIYELYAKQATALVDLKISKASTEKEREVIYNSINYDIMLNHDKDYEKISGEFYIYDMKNTIYPKTSSILGASIIKRNILNSNKNNGFFTIFDTQNKLYIFYSISNLYDHCLLLIVQPSDMFTNLKPVSNKNLIYGIISITVILMIFLFFKKQIYDPIISIEKALNGIFEGETVSHINVNVNNELYPTINILNKLIDRIRYLVNIEYTSKMLKKQAELNTLQSQINPHFLYNTLESIRSLALRENAKDVSCMTKALSNMFRYSISNKNDLVTLDEELKNIDNYLIIQNYRFKNRFKLIKDIDNTDSKVLTNLIPKLSLQILVENAIYHGLEKKIGGGFVKINIISTEKRLMISVIDNGVGMDDNTLIELNEKLARKTEEIIASSSESSGPGIALTNLNERIKLFYGSEYGLKVYSAEEVGTTVEILLPLLNRSS